MDGERGIWLQVVRGRLCTYVILHAGDGVGITDAEGLALRFEEDSGVLLCDVRMDAPLLWQ